MTLHRQMLRFTAVSVAGLGIDLGLAMALAGPAGLPLVAAATAGFAAGALFNYLVHEVWTFRESGASPSVARGSAYFAVLLAVLAIRTGIAQLLSPWATGAATRLAVLLVAFGASFSANFVLTRRVLVKGAGKR